MAKKKKFDYFDAFEEQAHVALREADLLIEAIEDFTSADALPDVLQRAHDIENEGDELNHAILKTVATDFITPIEREDIIEMAQCLDDVTDRIESVLQHFYMYNVASIDDDALEFAHLIKKSCKALDKAMEDFRNFKKSKKFKHLVMDVNDYEEEADRLHIEVIRGLCTDKIDDPVHVMVWTQLFDRMENCCDACEHASETMNSIMLKNV